MKIPLITIVFTSFLVSACVKTTVYKGENYTFIKSSHAIININGKQVDPTYALDINAGHIFLVVLYSTYRHAYYCHFDWVSKPHTTYEITDQENKYPLTLYRWERENDLWASRLDPVDPLKCSRENEYPESKALQNN